MKARYQIGRIEVVVLDMSNADGKVRSVQFTISLDLKGTRFVDQLITRDHLHKRCCAFMLFIDADWPT